jgi:D-beta-D-heptose 7-phosphate kinase/D-beta-D-heptose 1-phosphate adenosyltransferase
LGRVVSLGDGLRRRFLATKRGEKVVFTNGVFDLLHRGHLEYLSAARALGDVLFVGLNSDTSARRIKGDSRPFVQEDDRAYCLASLTPVDYVILFDGDTPLELIKALKPDVLVKGGDWRVESIVGYEEVRSHGGEVLSLPYREGYSTTRLLETIAASVKK